jgi:energy-coupling factor transporter ATP-binding protein EcfA2
MNNFAHFTSVRFHKFKGFKKYSISLRNFNILVGPNNCGKSTILDAFRILAQGMRKAKTRNPEIVKGPFGDTFGYKVDLSNIPLATENIFFDYDETEPATVIFRISNGNELELIFPEVGFCLLICHTKDRPVRSTTHFKNEYNETVAKRVIPDVFYAAERPVTSSY